MIISFKKNTEFKFDKTSKNTIFKIGKNACVTIIEKRQLPRQTEISLWAEEGSIINYFLTSKNQPSYDYKFTANLGKQSKIFWHFYGELENSHTILAQINHNNAESTGEIIAGLYAQKQSNISMKLINNHNAQKGKGQITFKGIGCGSAKADIRGLVRIEKKANHVASFLNENILLISNKSAVHAEPNMEILNDDVQAVHNAAIGKIDEEALKYMQARGITPKCAREILIKNFLKPILEKFNVQHI